MVDLLLLLADGNMKAALEAALRRPDALGVRAGLTFKSIVHSGHDGGLRANGAALADTMRRHHLHVLMVLDYEGSGASVPPDEVESRLDQELSRNWPNCGKAIVIHPEFDVWAWGSDRAIAPVLGWDAQDGLIRDWLRHKSFEVSETGKPVRPKEALHEICRHLKKPRSSSLYGKLAERISLSRCSDESFKRLVDTLRRWFPTPERGIVRSR